MCQGVCRVEIEFLFERKKRLLDTKNAPKRSVYSSFWRMVYKSDAWLEQFGRIFAGVYQSLNLVDYALAVGSIRYTEPF